MFPVNVPRIFKTATRVSVVESLFIKVTSEISIFYKSIENSLTCTGMFQSSSFRNFKIFPFNQSCRLGVYRNATKNELHIKFLGDDCSEYFKHFSGIAL